MEERIQHEIEHGKRIKKFGDPALWHWKTPAGKFRLDRRQKMLKEHITPNMHVLEICCGIGVVTRYLAETKAKILAIDISPDLLEVAQDNIKAANVTFKIENAYELTVKSESFDTIIGSSALHHLNLDKALNEFMRVLKPGGSLCFTEPNMLNPHIYLERNVPILKELLHVSPDESAFYRNQLSKDLQSHGFCNIRITPFDFLHPNTPKFFIPAQESIGHTLERIPLIREIAGSLYIQADKAKHE